jgi:hypothetical protein
MKRIIKLSILTFGLFFIYSSTLQAQDFKLGGGLVYGTEVESIGIEVGAVAGLTGDFRGAADFKYFFPDSPSGVDNTLWELNANVHYALFSQANAKVYGLAGLNYISQEVSGGGITVSDSEAGLNLGGGAEFGLGFASLYAELKYAISDWDQLDLSAGLRFGL